MNYTYNINLTDSLSQSSPQDDFTAGQGTGEILDTGVGQENDPSYVHVVRCFKELCESQVGMMNRIAEDASPTHFNLFVNSANQSAVESLVSLGPALCSVLEESRLRLKGVRRLTMTMRR